MSLPSLSDLIPRLHWAGSNPAMFPHFIGLRAVADHSIFYFLEGGGQARVGQQSFEVVAGDLLYCPPRTLQMIDADAARDSAYVWIHFGIAQPAGAVRPALARHLVGVGIEYLAPILIEPPIKLRDARLAPFRRHGPLTEPRQLALDIARLVQQDVTAAHGDAAAAALARARLIELIALYVAEPILTAENAAPPPHHRRLEWLFAEAEQHLGQPAAPTLAGLAARMKLSPRQFRRLCQSVFGMSPRQKLDDLRLRRACLLLQTKETQSTIASVARACGFEDSLYFSRWFNRRMGVTPTAYAATGPHHRVTDSSMP